jgi:hypothetical protein
MPAQHARRGQDNCSHSSGHPLEHTSLSSPPPSPPSFHRPTHASPPGFPIDNPPLSDEESPLAFSSYTRPSPGLQYVAPPHSYHLDPVVPPSQHMPNQQHFPINPQQYHYDNYGRPFGHYPDDRPLIHYVTNEWQHQPRSHDHSSDYSEDEFGHYMHDKGGFIPQEVINYLPRLRVPRRVQRWLLIYLLLLAMGLFGWRYWIAPFMEEEKRLDDAFAAAEKKGNKFGTNVRPSFTDMLHVKTLPDHLIPGNEYGDRRLIIIGDVHGCKHECMYRDFPSLSTYPYHSKSVSSTTSLWGNDEKCVCHRSYLTDHITYSAITSREGQLQQED